MLHIPPLPPDQAHRDVQAVYDNFAARMSFPVAPNFILTQGHSRQTVRGTWDLLRNILVEGELPRWQKELGSSRSPGIGTAAAARRHIPPAAECWA